MPGAEGVPLGVLSVAGRSAGTAGAERAEDELVAEIRVLHAASRGAYGAPRIQAALARAGRRVNRKEIERLMREHRVCGTTRCRRRGPTRQARRAVFAADLVRRDFTASRPGTRLVGDMTEPPARTTSPAPGRSVLHTGRHPRALHRRAHRTP
ncbi:IS3 family transposase [Streptomyces sp. NBC_01445]|uniref:IS3 family transposase n=1 Tax=Streptomyces sp. NBC_01445 TaxID=2903869 RepID=UPI003FA37AAC